MLSCTVNHVEVIPCLTYALLTTLLVLFPSPRVPVNRHVAALASDSCYHARLGYLIAAVAVLIIVEDRCSYGRGNALEVEQELYLVQM